jgi:hypothetical protein
MSIDATEILSAMVNKTRLRRTKAEMSVIRESIKSLLAEVSPMTVRQVFYQLVVRGVLEKSEREYKATVIRLLTEMRMDDTIPFEDIIDESTRRHTYRTYDSLIDAARNTAEYYRRNALTECSDYLEIYCGKLALMGFIHEAAGEYDVPVIPARGSLTRMWETALCVRNAWLAGKWSYIYFFDDLDPTALVSAKATERRLNEMCAKLDCPPPKFERVALTEQQRRKYRLPTRPTKSFKDGNRHAKNFKGESTELDALPPAVLKALVTACVEQHISQDQLDVLREAEESERAIITNWADRIERRGR